LGFNAVEKAPNAGLSIADNTPTYAMEKKKIELITAWRVYIIVLLWFVLFIGLLIFNAKILHWPPYVFILIGVLPLVFPIQLMKRIQGVSRKAKLSFDQDETVLMMEGKAYPISKLRWYRLDFNSPLAHQLILRFEDGQRLRLTVWADGSENEKQLWNLHEHIKTIATHQKLSVRDYYDRPQLRAISWVLLGTVPILWALPLLLPNTGLQLISALGIWTGTALSFFAVVRHAGRKPKP
jgi:uncharacterized membrane protein (DUF485 family)